MSTSPKSKPIVQISQLSKTYVEAAGERVVFKEADGAFVEGEFTAVLGRSGSGKSTLLNLISGVDEADGGQIIIGDTDVTRLKERERTLFRRNHIGIIFQSFNLIPTLTVLENITLPYELQGKSRAAAEKRARNLLDRVGLLERESTYPDRLSGGQQQRVAIARALVHEPTLILADEPTGNLDRKTGDQVLQLLLEITRDVGKTLVMATHSMEIVPYADRIFRVRDGKLLEDTYRLQMGAERRAQLEAQMSEEMARMMAEPEVQGTD
jgi:putative ABC transport system ATP-binding protein